MAGKRSEYVRSQSRLLRSDARREIRNLRELHNNYKGEAGPQALARLDTLIGELEKWASR